MAKKVLLADDSRTLTTAVRLALARTEFEVVHVDHGAAVLERAKEVFPDVILLDTRMPRTPVVPGQERGKPEPLGAEICRKIKADGGLARVPVILFPGRSESLEASDADTCGANGILAKPFTSQELLDRLTEVLEQPQPAVAEPAATVPETRPSIELPEEPTGPEPIEMPSFDEVLDVAPAQEALIEEDPLAGEPLLDETAPVGGHPPPPAVGAEEPAEEEFELSESDLLEEEDFEIIDEHEAQVPGVEETEPFAAEEPQAPSMKETEPFPLEVPPGPVAVETEPFPVEEPPAPRAEETVPAFPEVPPAQPTQHAVRPEEAPTVAKPSPGPPRETAAPPKRPEPTLQVSDEVLHEAIREAVEKVAWDAFSGLSETVVEAVVAKVEAVCWESIPQMAETILREELKKITDQPHRRRH